MLEYCELVVPGGSMDRLGAFFGGKGAMKIRLIVMSGRSAGHAIALNRSPLLIGRAEECHVRPLSEEVSRRHCAIHGGVDGAWAEDLGSHNGTFVNGVRITEKTKLADGDLICVGIMKLQVSCTEAAVPRSEDDVSKWLMADDAPAGMFDTTQTLPRMAAGKDDAAVADSSDLHAQPPAGSGSGISGGSGISSNRSSSVVIQAVKESQAKPGILPVAAKKSADSSRDAAAEALRKFFNNR